MENPEVVSVIMPCFNAEKTVKHSLESVIAQTFEDYKIYVVNDGSQDNTAAIIHHLQRQFPDKIVLIEQSNQGQTKAKNRAIEMSQGQYIALIDSDDLWQRDKLAKQFEFLKQNPEVGLCYTNGYYIDEKGHITGDVGVDPSVSGTCYERLMMGNAIVASSVMFRRALLEKTGPFDESLTACENWELWTRISCHSALYALKEKLICYRRHDQNMSLNTEKLKHNRLKVIQKNADQLNGLVPDLKQKTQEALYRMHLFFGENSLWHLKVSQARSELIQAIRTMPWRVRPYQLLIKSLLGKWGITKIRQWRGPQPACKEA